MLRKLKDILTKHSDENGVLELKQVSSNTLIICRMYLQYHFGKICRESDFSAAAKSPTRGASMTTAHEAKGPSVAELQRFIREKTELEFILSNGSTERGVLRWFDENAFSIQQDVGSLTVLRTGVIAYRTATKSTK